MKFIINIFWVALTGILLQVGTSVSAQEANMRVSPVKTEIVISPGKEVVIPYIMENKGDPGFWKLTVHNLKNIDIYGGTAIGAPAAGPITFSLSDGSSLDEPFILKSRESKRVMLKITVPEEISPADYYFSLMAQTQSPVPVEGVSSLQVNIAASSNILITVPDGQKIDLKGAIAGFSPSRARSLSLFGKRVSFFKTGDSVPILLKVENKGKNRIVPAGTITLRGNFGERADYKIEPQNIAAASTRVLAAEQARIECDKPDCSGSPTILLKGLFIGRYKVAANLTFGEGAPVLYAQTSFLALPLELIYILLGLGVGVLLFSLRKRVKVN